MKKTLLALLSILALSVASFGQTPCPPTIVYKYIVVSYDTLDLKTLKSGVPTKYKSTGTQLVIMELPTAHDEYDLSLSAVKVPKFDTIRTVSVSYVDDASPLVSISNMSKVGSTTKTGIYNGTFSYVTDTKKAALTTLTFTGTGIEFWGERFAQAATATQPANIHGTISISIDGVPQGTFNQGIAPLNTDFTRGLPTFRKTGLNASVPHTITISGAIGQQFVVDRFGVLTTTITLKPK